MNRSEDWVFTVNNLQLARMEGRSPWDITTMRAKYMVVQLEQGENGTPHYQGFIQFNSKRTFEQAKTVIGYECHLEARQGTPAEASEYCQKEDSRVAGPWEQGELQPRPGRGARTDVVAFRDAIISGKRNRELDLEYPQETKKYMKYIHWCRLAHAENYYSFRSIYLHVGETGTGKTKWVYDNEESFWKMPIQNGTNWYDNYQGDKAVLLDDFSGGFSKVGLTELLRLLDGYSDIVPVKNSFAPWKPDRIYITTNIWPDKWYDYIQPRDRMAHYRALVRRFTVVRHFNDDGVIEYDTKESIANILTTPPPLSSLLMPTSNDYAYN